MPLPCLTPDDLSYHKRLVTNINAGNAQINDAHANLARAILANDKAVAAMNTWVAHITEKYGLLPEDAVSHEGTFMFLDPGWPALLEQARLEAEANKPAPVEEPFVPHEQEFADGPGSVTEISDEHPEGVAVAEMEAEPERPAETGGQVHPLDHPEDGGPVRVLPVEPPPVALRRANGNRPRTI